MDVTKPSNLYGLVTSVAPNLMFHRVSMGVNSQTPVIVVVVMVMSVVVVVVVVVGPGYTRVRLPGYTQAICYTIVPPGRKTGFRAGFRSDSRENA